MTLNIVEIPYESGALKFRYARRLSADAARWVRDGPFQSFYENGQISAEGHYEDGLETGVWSTYHDNGQPASRGRYQAGRKADGWEFWDADGQSETGQ
jgi:antitoxin component YwqK of YwqJK toxin-antitoxin module